MVSGRSLLPALLVLTLLGAAACADPRPPLVDVEAGPAATGYRFASEAPPPLIDRHLGKTPFGCRPAPEPSRRKALREAARAVGLSRETRQALFATLPTFVQNAIWR